MRRRALLRGLGASAALFALGGCSQFGTSPARRAEPGINPASFAKTDADRIAEDVQREVFASLRLLAEKFYKRNPREWKKINQPSMEAAISRIFEQDHRWRLAELDNKRDIEAMRLAFNPAWQGDRVCALIVGMAGMVQTAFGDRTQFYAFDSIDAQALYNAARNVEVVAWKLESTLDPVTNEPLLLANEGTRPRNLSFEREFGKIIGELDVLSHFVAEKQNRGIVRVVQSITTAVFLPIK